MSADFTELLGCATDISIILGIIFSYLQIKKVSKSIEVGQKANSINVLNFFAKEYDSLMLEAEQCRCVRKVELWYYRFWNLLKNEFLFFEEGLLDDYIFEFWAYKICIDYDFKPRHIPLQKVDTFKKNHRKYLKEHNGNHPDTESFFLELIGIADGTNDKEEMRRQVHCLVRKYKRIR